MKQRRRVTLASALVTSGPILGALLTVSVLLLSPQTATACTYAGEAVFPLRTVVNNSTDVILCRFHAVRGPVLDEGDEHGFVFHRADSVVVDVERVLKGDLEPGPMICLESSS